MSSLRSRLGAGLVLGLVATIGLLLLIAGLSLHRLMEQQVASRLAHDGDTLLSELELREDGSASLNPQHIQGIYRRPFSGHYFLVDVEGRQIRSRSLWDETLPLRQGEPGAIHLAHIEGPAQQPLLLWSGTFTKQGRLVRVVVAEDLHDLQVGAWQVWWQLLGWSALMVAFVLLVQRALIARSLRPVADVVEDVARLERGEVSALREQVPREILPLVQEINRLLERQRQRLLRSREALGNMAHAIKTPLTLLQQIALEQTRAGDSATREQVERYIDRINELVDTALRRARIAGDSLGAGRFDLDRDLAVLVDTVGRLHRDKSVRFERPAGRIQTLPLEQQDGMELLGNLLDNAWKWARARVRLSFDGSPEEPVVIIEDDGPGVAEANLDELMQRGVRHDENMRGHGIGLSIVQSLVEALGASIVFDRSPELGGLRVRVYLKWPEASTGTSQ
jgi:signal transduction histidine kinase